MPVGTNNYPFANGVNARTGYGDRWVVTFSGTWAFGDLWSVKVTSTQGDITFGEGYFAGLTPTVCFTYRDREYLGMGSQVNFSDNGDPTGWEIQNPGAGFILYLSQFGGQDTVEALSQIQGRLAILATNSIQIWIVDADPSQFSLQQTLDNIGTEAPLSVQNIGDLDVLFLDDTGFRSLRAREVTLNAYVDDAGTPVDTLVRDDLLTVNPDTAVGIVEPTTKNYWCYLNGKIYVYSKHLASKIAAWSTYVPTYMTSTPQILVPGFVGSTASTFTVVVGQVYHYTKGNTVSMNCGGVVLSADGDFTATDTTATIVYTTPPLTHTGTLSITNPQVVFTPQKFVNYLKRTYCRSLENLLLLYGGSTNAIYDTSLVTVETPYLDDKSPATNKSGQGINFALAGAWTISVGTDPVSGTLTTILSPGDGANPNEDKDSSYDIGRIAYSAIGTHFKMKAVSSGGSQAIAILSALLYTYNRSEVQ